MIGSNLCSRADERNNQAKVMIGSNSCSRAEDEGNNQAKAMIGSNLCSTADEINNQATGLPSLVELDKETPGLLAHLYQNSPINLSVFRYNSSRNLYQLFLFIHNTILETSAGIKIRGKTTKAKEYYYTITPLFGRSKVAQI